MINKDDLDLDSSSASDVDDSSSMPVGTSSMKLQPPPPMDPILSDYLKTKANLADAQTQANRNEMLTGLARAGASLSAGLAHSDKPVDDRPFAEMAQADQAPVRNIAESQKTLGSTLQNQQALMANERQMGDEDPTSVQSRASQKLIKSLYPGKFDDATLDTMSKAQIGDSIMKPLELDQKIKEHADEQRNKALDRQAAAKDKEDLKASADQNKAMDFVVSKLNTGRADPAANQARLDRYSVQKINSLINLYGDPNKLSPQQVKLLAEEVAKVATGGIPGEATTQGLTPNTLRGRGAELLQNMTNEPTSAHAAEFVKNFKAYADSIDNDAKAQIKSQVDSILNPYQKRLGDENYQNLRDEYYKKYGFTEAGSAAAGGGSGSHSLQDLIAEKQRRMNSRLAQAPMVPVPNFANPAASQGRPSLFVQPGQNPAPDEGYAFGGTVKPHMPAPPKVVVPHMDKRMTTPAHFACGGTVHGYAEGGQVQANPLDPDRQRAREAMAGAEKGETLAEGWKNLKNEFGLSDKDKNSKNYARGGAVGGTPIVPFNSPINDTQTIKATPGEVVLPLSVTTAKDPALAAYLFMKQEMAKKHG
jgi:hypothetical protein